MDKYIGFDIDSKKTTVCFYEKHHIGDSPMTEIWLGSLW